MQRQNIKRLVDTLQYVNELVSVSCDALRGYVDEDVKVIEQPKIEQVFEQNLGRVGKNIYEHIKSLYHREEKNEDK